MRVESGDSCKEMMVDDVDYSLIEGDIALLYDEIKDSMSDGETFSIESELVSVETKCRPTLRASAEHDNSSAQLNHTLPVSLVIISSDSDSEDDKLTDVLEKKANLEVNVPLPKSSTVVKRTSLGPETFECYSEDARPCRSNSIDNLSQSSNQSHFSSNPPSQQRKRKLSELKPCPEEATQTLIQMEVKNNDQNVKTNNHVNACDSPYVTSDCEKEENMKSVAEDTATKVASLPVKLSQKKKSQNEYETEYELSYLSSTVRDYILEKGVRNKYIKGISHASVYVRRSLVTQETELGEKPLHLLVQGPTKQSVHLAVQLIKFLETKVKEIEGRSSVEKNENKILVRKIGEKTDGISNDDYQKNDKTRLLNKLHEPILKSRQIKKTVQENMREKIKECEKLRKKIVTENRGAVLQKEEIRVLSEIQEEDKIKTNNNEKEVFDFQKVCFNYLEKKIERDKTLQTNQTDKKDQTIEKLKFNNKEKENSNEVIKVNDQYKKKRKYDLSKENRRKKIKTTFEEKVFVDLEDAPACFNVVNRVEGPRGVNLQYISNYSQTHITLRGRGSGFQEDSTGQESKEPLHICIQHFLPHKDPRLISKAKRLATDLISNIKQEYQEFCQQSADVKTSSEPSMIPNFSFLQRNKDQLKNASSLQYPIFPYQQQSSATSNHPSQNRTNSSPYSDTLQVTIAKPLFQMSRNNRGELVPLASSNSSFGPLSQTLSSTTVQRISNRTFPAMNLARPQVSTVSSLKSNLSQSSNTVVVSSSDKVIQTPPLSHQYLNEFFGSSPQMYQQRTQNVLPGSYASCQPAVKGSQFFQKPLSIVCPASTQPLLVFPISQSQSFYKPLHSLPPQLSQSPLGSPISGIQSFYKPLPSAPPPFSQSPLGSPISESQSFHKSAPSVPPPFSQHPLGSSISESQSFHKPAPSVPPLFSQPPLGSPISESQSFHKPAPCLKPSFSRSLLGSPISESQSIHKPPSSVPSPFSQPPLGSSISESQSFHKPAPSVKPPFSQSPLGSPISESQSIHKPPSSVPPPSFQFPLGSLISESQSIHKPPSSVPPPFSQFQLGSPISESQSIHKPLSSVPPPASQFPLGSLISESQSFHKPTASLKPSFSQSLLGSTISESQSIHKPPLSVSPPLSQSPLGSPISGSQSLYKLLPSVSPPLTQSPLGFPISESQSFHKPPPSVSPPLSQSPLGSPILESQSFHKPPPSVSPPLSQSPLGSPILESQSFHKPMPIVQPQSPLDSVSFNQKQTQIFSQNNNSSSYLFRSPLSNRSGSDLVCNPNNPSHNYSQSNVLSSINSSLSQSAMLSALFQPQLRLLPQPIQSSMKSTVSKPQLTTHIPLKFSSSQNSYPCYTHAESSNFQPQFLQKSQIRSCHLQSPIMNSQGSSQPQLSVRPQLQTVRQNSSLFPCFPKPVSPPAKHLLQKYGLECSSSIEPKSKNYRWDVEVTPPKTISQRSPVEALTPTTEQQNLEQKLQLLEEINTQNSNSSLSAVEILANMLNSLKESLQEGLLKTKINQTLELVKFAFTNKTSAEKTKHHKMKVAIIVQVLEKLFESHKDSCLDKFRPVLNQLKRMLDIPTGSSRERGVPLCDRESLPANKHSRHKDESQAQSRTSERNRRHIKLFNSQLEFHLQQVIKSLQVLTELETRQIRKIMFTEELDVLKNITVSDEEIMTEYYRTGLMRTLTNLEKHSTASMLDSIKVLKHLMQNPSSVLDSSYQTVSVDLSSPKHNNLKQEAIPVKYESPKSLGLKSEVNSWKSQTTKGKCPAADINKRKTLKNKALPDLILTAVPESDQSSDKALSS